MSGSWRRSRRLALQTGGASKEERALQNESNLGDLRELLSHWRLTVIWEKTPYLLSAALVHRHVAL